MGIRLGDLLVRRGVLTGAQRDAVLGEQRVSGRPFGEIAELRFGVRAELVEDAWAEQYADGAMWIDPRLEFVDPTVLTVIERRQAWQFRFLPVRRDGEELMACTTRENLVRALRFAGWRIPRVCFFVLAEPRPLGEALARYYPLAGMTPDMVAVAQVPGRSGR